MWVSEFLKGRTISAVPAQSPLAFAPSCLCFFAVKHVSLAAEAEQRSYYLSSISAGRPKIIEVFALIFCCDFSP